MDTHKKMRELVSALVDGEISDADLELAFAALLGPDGQQAWSAYHLIGDVLRQPDSPALSGDFAARLAARLQSEPAPARRIPAVPHSQEPQAENPPAPVVPGASG